MLALSPFESFSLKRTACRVHIRRDSVLQVCRAVAAAKAASAFRMRHRRLCDEMLQAQRGQTTETPEGEPRGLSPPQAQRLPLLGQQVPPPSGRGGGIGRGARQQDQRQVPRPALFSGIAVAPSFV